MFGFKRKGSLTFRCWCGSNRLYKNCHYKSDQRRGAIHPQQQNIPIKTKEQIEGIRRAGMITAQVLDMVDREIRIGMTTEDINELVHAETLRLGAIPAPLNYRGFPKSVCTSLNDVICHGIPSRDVVLRDGDIINVDVTCIVDGYYGDASRMYLLGDVSDEARALVETARRCLELGIEQVKPGNTLGDIGHAIQQYAESSGYSVVRAFTGHGTGVRFHEPPEVLHVGQPGRGIVLVPGMTFTIEPMINMGSPDCRILRDGWTAVTRDGSLSAQWEHTLLVTPEGVEILTRSPQTDAS
ncbi:MAG: methionyl aminopeptidase [Lentisphaerae bacterium]|nr:MAG: methionyl aminopeptidase [Lentisphaerota bacterium]